MADFKLIALIFAVCLLVDSLYRAFQGTDEEVKSPPVPDDVNTQPFEPGIDPDTYHENPHIIGQKSDIDEDGSEFEYFDDTTDPEDETVVNINQAHTGSESKIRTINILYCIQ